MLTFNRVGSIWNKIDPEQRLRVAVLGRTVRPAFCRTTPSCTIGGALRQPLCGFHCPDSSKNLSRRTLPRWNRLRLAS
jgi:hypothetical protein